MVNARKGRSAGRFCEKHHLLAAKEIQTGMKVGQGSP